jgi:hypothetical protein
MKALLRSNQIITRNAAKRSSNQQPNMRNHFKSYLSLLISAAILALLAGPGFYSPPAGAQSVKARYQQDIEQVFTNHEDLKLDAPSAAEQVRENGHLSLVTRSHDFEIQLRPNDLRASNYRAQEVADDGVAHDIPMSPVNTYKGSVEGIAGTDARFTVKNNNIEGMIVTPGESYFLEAANKYSASAVANDYLLYKASDVRPDITRTCGDTLDQKVSLGAKQMSFGFTTSATPNAFSPFKVVEIATEADFEYVSDLGNSTAANNDILSIMNQVQAIYERDLGLTFSVVFQHAWATANDPYNTSGDAGAALNEFTTYWNANFANQPRDVTHLWTGRNLGGPAGVAWMGTVCRDPLFSYGLSNFETVAPFRVGIPAHEIGHSLNASHCDGQAGCDNTIMVASLNQSNTLTFGQFSRDEMTSYVNANSSCLTNASTANPIDQADFFVRQHYSDFLNRATDQSGLDFWKSGITNCGADQTCMDFQRVNTSGAFFLSIEFQQTGYLSERFNKTSYGDASGTSTFQGTHQLSVPVVRFLEFVSDMQTLAKGVVVGQAGWEQVLENNKQAYAAEFATRRRFTDAYPTTMTPSVFVQTLNTNAGSPLSSAELTQLIAEHTAGTKNRAQVLRQIAEHPNLVNAEMNRAFVLMQFFGYLRRNPNDTPDSDYTGYDFWLMKLNQFGGDFRAAEMVRAFIASNEYRRRFGTP